MMRHFIAVLLCGAYATASAINTTDAVVKDNKPALQIDPYAQCKLLPSQHERGMWGSFLYTHNARLIQMVTKLVAEKNKALSAQAGS